MKSKEAIRNQILTYTNLIWDTKKIERMDLLVRMMIEELTNELYLVQNKLNDIDMLLLEKIAKKLTPAQYVSIRPAHTVLQITPNLPVLMLDKETPFFSNDIPTEVISEKADAIAFYPIAETCLLNLKINYQFHDKQLYAIDANGRKELVFKTERQSTFNTVWLGLEVDEQVKDLKGLAFYIDFPGLSEIHDYYEVLPYTTCFIGGREVELIPEFPVHSKTSMSGCERDILRIYQDHYLTISESVPTTRIQAEKLPEELSELIDPEAVGDLKPMYWVQLQFRPNFTTKDLGRALIAVNTIPVLNKKFRKIKISREQLNKTAVLPSDVGEKLLSIDAVMDQKLNTYVQDMEVGNNDQGTYHLEVFNPIFAEDQTLADHMEQLLDLIDEERVAFPHIDKDQIEQIMTSITKTDEESSKKVNRNIKTDSSETGWILVNPHEYATTVKVDYWVTYGELINGIAAGGTFIPHKTSSLDGLVAMSLCEIHGGKEFTEIEDVMLINRYIFTSKDRIITEHNIKCFCQSELGRALDKVEIELGGKISPKPKEGLIRVINLKLTPSIEYPEMIYRKGVLKDLKVRLEQRSPDSYNYVIQVIDNL